jgi:topoisomerase-4 subunit B
MRLTPVVIDEDHSISEVLSFYMGKNTKERYVHIMENLEVDEENV